jgi:hypothetical protein
MVSQLIRTVALFAMILLVGCVRLPSEIQGVYHSDNGQAIRIKQDGEILWSEKGGEQAEFNHLGILGYSKKSRKTHLVMASAHPLFGTDVSFDDDRQAIRVDWRSLLREFPIGDRAKEYRKQQ